MNTCRECKYSAIDGGSTSHIRCLAFHNEVADIRNGLIGDCQAFEQKEASASPAASMPDTVLIEAAVSFLAGKFYCELSQREHSMYAAAKEGGRMWCDGIGRLRRH